MSEKRIRTNTYDNSRADLRLSDDALDQLFRTARTHHSWTDRPVCEDQIHELYDMVKLGPTATPGRFLFLTSEAAKIRLSKFVFEGNENKILKATVVVIVAEDVEF